jgi:hypothetical protein
MNHVLFSRPYVVFFLLLLPSCRIVDWGKDKFYQGNQLDKNEEIAHRYMRSVTVYDQFETKAMFDALWLSSEVRTLYADLHSRKHGKLAEQKNNFLRRQLEETTHYLSFFVLSLYEVPLGEKDVDWSLFLRANDRTFFPTEIKSIDLVPEYRALFGKRMSRFKLAYRVKFDAQDVEGNPAITRDTKQLTLYFRSVEKEVSLVWELDEHSVVVNDTKKKQA